MTTDWDAADEEEDVEEDDVEEPGLVGGGGPASTIEEFAETGDLDAHGDRLTGVDSDDQ